MNLLNRPKVLAYYFPNFHADARNEDWYGKGFTEWDLVRAARPRYENHQQPRVPLLGYGDEADPAIMAADIDLAADHGVDGFIFDYYWYDGRPYLHGALERGFLRAPNNDRLEFSLMWANHDWSRIHPSAEPHVAPPTLATGGVGRAEFERFVEYIATTYFVHPSYTRIDGRPRFSIYELGGLIASLGGVEQTIDALQWMDDRVRQLGFPGLHLDIVVWSFAVLPTEVAIVDPADIARRIGARSVSSYVWIHHAQSLTFDFPANDDWDVVCDVAFAEYERFRATFDVPMHPNVTVGWDPSPRCAQDEPFVAGHYPWMATWRPSPQTFHRGLEKAISFEAENPGYREITVNAWNEWTEGSYLLPDELYGATFLESIRDTLGVRVGES